MDGQFFHLLIKKHGPAHDLTRRSTQLAVIETLFHSDVGYLHLGTPCTVFSQARHNIQNSCRARERERVGCELAFFTAELCRNAHSKNIFWCIENPSSSRLWEFWAIKELKLLDNVFEVRFPMCKFGMPYKKPTTLLTNCPLLKKLAAECHHKRHAEQLRGRTMCKDGSHTLWLNKTQNAAVYPPELCRQWCQAIKAVLENASDKYSADAAEITWALETAQRKQGFRLQFPQCAACEVKHPGILETIAFGQHSKAEMAARRASRLKQQYQRKAMQQEAAQEARTFSGGGRSST